MSRSQDAIQNGNIHSIQCFTWRLYYFHCCSFHQLVQKPSDTNTRDALRYQMVTKTHVIATRHVTATSLRKTCRNTELASKTLPSQQRDLRRSSTRWNYRSRMTKIARRWKNGLSARFFIQSATEHIIIFTCRVHMYVCEVRRQHVVDQYFTDSINSKLTFSNRESFPVANHFHRYTVISQSSLLISSIGMKKTMPYSSLKDPTHSLISSFVLA